MQFRRKAEIILGNRGFKSSEFDFEFDVEFDDTPDLNHADILIYNLSNTTVNSIRNKMPIIINAGYEGDVGSVFVGAIYDMDTIRNGVDRETTIKAIDASDQRGKFRANRSYKKGIRASQIIVDLCSMSGLSIGALSLPNDVQYRSGKNINGKILTLLKQIAKDCKAKFHISKGMAYFRGKNEGHDVRFVFNSSTGLIGSPEPFVEEDEEDENKEIKGFNVTALLNHRVQADSIIELDSRVTKGKYRVRAGTHSYSESEMITEMEVV